MDIMLADANTKPEENAAKPEDDTARPRETEDERRERIADVRQEQIDLLGSEALYERINQSLKMLKFDPFFAEEQLLLYFWRFFDYFEKEFGERYTSILSISVVILITQHFDEVVARTDPYRDSYPLDYFEENESSATVRKTVRLFDIRYIKDVLNSRKVLSRRGMKFLGMSVSDVLHMIAAAYRNDTKPLTLEHLAMKKALETQAPLTRLPRVLQEKAAKGWFQTSDQVKQFVDDEGKKTLEIFQRRYEK